MPRGRGKKEKNNEVKPEKPKEEETDERIFNMDDILSLDELHEFLKVEGSKAMALCYKVKTSDLTSERYAEQLQSELVKRLMSSAKNNRIQVSQNMIHTKAFPHGQYTYVKAWFDLNESSGKMSLVKDNTLPRKMPKEEGLFIEEEERIVG